MLDVNLNGVVFEGMTLAGTIMIVNGFLLVLLPENWPDYLTRLLRYKKKTKPANFKYTNRLFFLKIWYVWFDWFFTDGEDI